MFSNTHQVQSALDEYVQHTLIPNSEVIHETVSVNGGAANQTSSTWTIQPGEGSMLSRKMLVKMPVNVATGTSQGSDFALKSLPLNRILTNVNIKINGNVHSCSASVLANLKERFHTSSEYRSQHCGTTATAPDFCNVTKQGSYLYPSQLANNVLGNPNYYQDEITRRSYTAANSSDVAVGSTTNTITIVGELPIHQLLSDDESDVFYNVKSFEITLLYRTDLDASMFTTGHRADTAAALYGHSDDVVAAVGARTVTLGVPELFITSFTPNEIVNMPLTQTLNTEHFEIHSVNMSVLDGTHADEANRTKTAQQLPTITTTVVPDYITIFAVATTPLVSDANLALSIKGVDLTFGNRGGVLSSASTQALYEISKKNGLSSEMSYQRWNSDCGSYLRLKVGEDIPKLIPGERTHFKMRGNINLTNNSFGADKLCTLYVIYEYNGKFSVTENMSQLSVGKDQSEVQGDVTGDEFEHVDKATDGGGIVGGGFFKKLGRAFKKVVKPVLSVGNVAAPLLGPQAQAALATGNVANQLLGGGSNLGGSFQKPHFNQPMSLREMVRK